MFRFTAIRVLLTYSQVPEEVTKETIVYTIDERYPVEEYTVGEELHADGGRHIHCVFVFKQKIDSRDVTLFDVTYSPDHPSIHPNIRPIQRGKAHLDRAIEYVTKEDLDPFTNVPQKLTWGEMMERANSADEYLGYVRQHYPRDYALNYLRLEAMALKHWPISSMGTIENFEPTYEWNAPFELITTVLPVNKSVVVVGPAGCGKTTWAKIVAPKPTLFIRHLDSLCNLLPSHRSIIFDDLEFTHLPPSTQKFLVDVTDLAEIHVRYRVARIPSGVLRIFTANDYPFTDGGIHAEAIRRRIHRININQ